MIIITITSIIIIIMVIVMIIVIVITTGISMTVLTVSVMATVCSACQESTNNELMAFLSTGHRFLPQSSSTILVESRLHLIIVQFVVRRGFPAQQPPSGRCAIPCQQLRSIYSLPGRSPQRSRTKGQLHVRRLTRTKLGRDRQLRRFSQNPDCRSPSLFLFPEPSGTARLHSLRFAGRPMRPAHTQMRWLVPKIPRIIPSFLRGDVAGGEER